MTAVIHHGPPGSYKSFSIVQNVVIPALQQGRTVCTNIRGLNDIDRIRSAMGVDIPDSARLICIKHDSEDGFQYMARFFQWAPIGALIVMDEGQRVYPTRLKSLAEFDTPADQRETLDSGVQRPATVENAFDQHRHMNWDIYISTTNIGKIHKEVRAVAEFGYRHREMSGVLPWWKNSWREFKHDPETSGKSVSHYIGTPVRRKADPRVFECYQSTATGKAKGSNENKSVFSDPKLRVFLGIIAAALIYFFYSVAQVVDRLSGDSPLPDSQAGSARIVSDRNVDPVGTDSHGPAHDPAVTPGTDSYFDTFRKTVIPDYSAAAYMQLVESKEWKLTGVIQGRRSVALLRSLKKTREIELYGNCYFEPRENDWLCLFHGELVAAYTGPDFSAEENTQDDSVSVVQSAPALLTGRL